MAYIEQKSSELTQRIKYTLNKYDKMLQETKSESDSAWIEDNIAILNDGLIMLGSIPTRCDYYDSKVVKYLDPGFAVQNKSYLATIEAECATELSKLFSEVGSLIGRGII